ncbi:DUF4183 domain-containing protein [Pseudalkalibacillus sp. SCS-8]|uniref:DUF4183 domain-containing protein n=1 Tax=Pseudalkalibacillus nanhaiensis TaxID=3115291 RepID=UPI0032DA3A0F
MVDHRKKETHGKKQCTFDMPPASCPLIYPRHHEKNSRHRQSVLKVETYTYFTRAKGTQRVYTNEDELTEYGGDEGIIDPANVSYFNLFVNGILQPHSLYDVEEGCLILNSVDLPPQGAPISLQFIVIS